MVTAIFYDIEEKIKFTLENARSSVKIAVAWLTNPDIFRVLESIVEKGIEIQLVVSEDKRNFSIAASHFISLMDKDVEIRVTRFPYLMHHKFCIVDNHTLITGSYNWTKGAEIYNHENVIVTTEKTLIDLYVVAFDELLTVTDCITTSEMHDIVNNEDLTVSDISFKEVERMSIQSILDKGGKFGKVRKYKSQREALYVPLEFSPLMLESYDLGISKNGKQNDTLLLHFSYGAKAILKETDNRISKSRMEVVERQSFSGKVKLLICALGEKLDIYYT